MPGKSRPVVCRIVIAEIIQQQKGIKILRFAETEARCSFTPAPSMVGFG
jgi:hypothetical protein